MIKRAGAVALVAFGLLCLVNLNLEWVKAQQSYVATVVVLTKPDATKGAFTTVDGIAAAVGPTFVTGKANVGAAVADSVMIVDATDTTLKKTTVQSIIDLAPGGTAATISAALAGGSEAQINAFTDQATNLSGTLTATPTGWKIEDPTTSNATDLSIKCTDNSLPINYHSIWTDFGGGNETDSHGWYYNANGEIPTEWGMAAVLETPFSGLMEYWWSYQAPTASAFTTWRPMFTHLTQATSVAEIDWGYNKMKWFANPNSNANPESVFDIDTDLELVWSTAAFGVGGPARADANGAMFKVAGSAGTSLEHVVIAPTQMTAYGTVVSLQIPTVAGAAAFGAQGTCSDALTNSLRNLHATGGVQDTLWTAGGDPSTRYLSTNGDWAEGVDNSDNGAFKVAASYQLDNLTALRIDKTTLRSDFSGAILAKTLVEANTAGSGAPNVIVAAESRTTYTNEGSTAQNYHTLPAAAAGVKLRFICQDADGIRIVAAAGDTIRNAATASAAAGFIQCTTIGNVIDLEAINATEWFTTTVIGTWTIDS